MTKAEERALVAYPPRYAKCIIFPETVGADFNTLQRKSYQQGYEQAEKDLSLTWEDARLIVDIGNSILDECYKKGIEPHLIYQTERQFSEEIIKRFKEAKK